MIAYVSDIMAKNLITIDSESGICKAERFMTQYNIGCLPVLENGALVGIITSKNIRQSHPNRIVADAMTSPAISVPSRTSIWKAKHKLEKHKIEKLLVVDEGKLVGLVTKTQLYTEIGKHMDLLTGLYRSNYIYHVGCELLEQENEVSVIFIDLNKFGQIDKEYGHTHGDMILKELSELLECCTPEGTHLCRFGGDEFVIVAPYELDKCRVLAEKLLRTISSNKFYKSIDVSASAGIASSKRITLKCLNHADTISNLVNLASLASSKAKREKRSLVIAECSNSITGIA